MFGLTGKPGAADEMGRRASCVRAACVMAAWLLLEAEDAFACGQCIDRAVRGGTWWLWPLLLSLGAVLFLEAFGFWVASRLGARPVLHRRGKAMVLAVGIGLGLAILTVGSVAVFLLSFAVIMIGVLLRALRAARDGRRSWTLARLILIGGVPLFAALASYPGFRTTESLLDASLDIRSGALSTSAGWPELELARRPDALATIEKRYESYKTHRSNSFEVPLLVLLHYELDGPQETRRAWCEAEKLDHADELILHIWKGIKSACPPAPGGPPNQSMQPSESVGD